MTHALNEDIKLFPQVTPITDDMHLTYDGVGRLIMLDRYAFKDTKKETLKVGDTVVLTVKSDPQFPARGIGVVYGINNTQVLVKLEEAYAQHGNEFGYIIVSPEEVDKPLELYYEQIARRNARGLASVEATDELRKKHEDEFYEQLVTQNFVPAGRVLYGAGSEAEVTFFNCFGGETLVQTKGGVYPIKDLVGEEVEVLSLGGIYRKADIKNFGKQELFEVKFSNGESVRATANHRWLVNSKHGLKEMNTLQLKGKNIPLVKKSKDINEKELLEGIRNGIVYGDGSATDASSYVSLFGEKKTLLKYFEGFFSKEHLEKDYVRVSKLPKEWKSLPSDSATDSYWHGFIVGLIATDGFVDNRGSFGFHSAKLKDLQTIANNINKTNFQYSGINMTRELSPYNGEISPAYRMQLVKYSAELSDFIKPSHAKKYAESASPKKLGALKVVDVVDLNCAEDVYCAVEPETQTFAIGTGILTRNCYVQPYPSDSREGIAKHRGETMEIMSRGGGVGTNGSTLRPRNALARGVNGKSSGSVSWLNDIAQLTHLVEQGGSRRGAQMIMMADWHPDIIEFIISKMQNPNVLRKIIRETDDEQIRSIAEQKLKFTPLTEIERDTLYYAFDKMNEYAFDEEDSMYSYVNKKLEDGGHYSVHNPDFLTGANISVAITKEFMDAVEDDTDYALRFPDVENYSEYDMALYDDHWAEVGDVREWENRGMAVKTYRTIKAKALWSLINTCATYAAEPGVFFIDNANDATNASAYGQKVVATNPLVKVSGRM